MSDVMKGLYRNASGEFEERYLQVDTDGKLLTTGSGGGGGGGGTVGGALDTTLSSVLGALNTGTTHNDLVAILTQLQGDRAISAKTFVDSTGTVYAKVLAYNQTTNGYGPAVLKFDGTAYTPVLPEQPIETSDLDTVETTWKIKTGFSGAGYAAGDIISQYVFLKPGTPATVAGSLWANEGVVIVAPPVGHRERIGAVAATESTLATRLAEGTPITAATPLEGGGASALGWLSSLREKVFQIYTVLTSGTINVVSAAGMVLTNLAPSSFLPPVTQAVNPGDFYITAMDVSDVRSMVIQMPNNVAVFTGQVRVYSSNSNSFATAIPITGQGVGFATLPAVISGQTYNTRYVRYVLHAKFLWVELNQLSSGPAPTLLISMNRDDRSGQEMAGTVRISDGGNFQSVAPANTAPTAAQTASVVGLSPNSLGGAPSLPLYQASASAVTLALATVSVVNGDLITGLDISQFGYLAFQLTGGAGVLTIFQSDDNVAYTAVSSCWNESTGLRSSTVNALNQLVLIPRIGKHIRIRATTYSGTPLVGQLVGLNGDFPDLGTLTESTFAARIPLPGVKTVSASVPMTLSSDPKSATTPITVLNANLLAGVATVGSTVGINGLDNCQTLIVNVVGTYTGSLGVQIQVDGTNWIFVDNLIPAGATGNFYFNVAACRNVRVTSATTITGTANVTLAASITEGPPTSRSGMVVTNGSITTGGASQASILPNFNRRGVEIRNNSVGDLWFKFAAIPATVAIDNGYLIKAGEVWSPPPNSSAPFQALTIFGATTGQKFIITEYI